MIRAFSKTSIPRKTFYEAFAFFQLKRYLFCLSSYLGLQNPRVELGKRKFQVENRESVV